MAKPWLPGVCALMALLMVAGCTSPAVGSKGPGSAAGSARQATVPDFALPTQGFDPVAFEADPARAPSVEEWASPPVQVRSPGAPSHAFQGGPCNRRGAPVEEDFTAYDDLVREAQKKSGFLSGNLGISDERGLVHEKGFGVLGPRPWGPGWAPALE